MSEGKEGRKEERCVQITNSYEPIKYSFYDAGMRKGNKF